METTPHETPAERVTRLLGGISNVADAAGVSTVQVRRWSYPADRGGTGGYIPRWRHAAILEWAKARSVHLTMADLHGIAPADNANDEPQAV